MRKKKTLVLLGSICLILVAIPLAAACAPAATEVITVRMIRPFPYDNDMSASYRMHLERGNEMGEGSLIFKDLGGPEVFPTFEQTKAVIAGAVDFIDTPSGYQPGQFYEASLIELFTYGAIGPELREWGMVDALDRIGREKHGLTFLGIPTWYIFHIFLKEPIDSMADLNGRKIRSLPMYDPVLQSYGASTIAMPFGEIYTAMETGVIDGFAFPSLGMVPVGLHELARYFIWPPMWVGSAHVAMANAAWFDALPGKYQDILVELTKEVERDSVAVYQANFAKEHQAYIAAGMEPIIISDAEWFQVMDTRYAALLTEAREHTEYADELIGIGLSPQYPPSDIWWPPYFQP